MMLIGFIEVLLKDYLTMGQIDEALEKVIDGIENSRKAKFCPHRYKKAKEITELLTNCVYENEEK